MKSRIAENCAFGFLVFYLYCSFSLAYTGTIPPDPDNPEKCVYRGDTLKLGVNAGTAPCQRLTCMQDGSIKIEGCGKLRIEKCNRGERVHTGKPFPECCLLRYKCEKSDGAFYYIERDVSESIKENKFENST